MGTPSRNMTERRREVGKTVLDRYDVMGVADWTSHRLFVSLARKLFGEGEEVMSRSHFGVGRLTLLVIPIVVAGGLTVRTADQNAQPAAPAVTTTQSTPAATELKASPPGPRTAGDAVIPPAVPAIVVASEPDGPHRIDPSRVMPKPDGRLAPDLEIGIMAPAAATSPVPGNVGPDGKPIGQDAPLSPDGSATVVDKTTERLGPGGLASAQTLRSPEPGTSPNSSGPAGAQQQQVGKANVTDHSSPAPTEPAAATGLTAFIDPATGQLVEPTDAQLAELERLRTANRPAPRPAEVVERPGENGGMVADVPTSFFPLVKATVDADGQVTIQESQAGDQSPVASTLGPAAEQPLRSVEAQRLGPAGDPSVELPPSPNATIRILPALRAPSATEARSRGNRRSAHGSTTSPQAGRKSRAPTPIKFVHGVPTWSGKAHWVRGSTMNQARGRRSLRPTPL